MTCIIQSRLHKCVLAGVSPQEPQVLPHRAQEAPHVEPPSNTAFVIQLEKATVAFKTEKSIPCLLLQALGHVIVLD